MKKRHKKRRIPQLKYSNNQGIGWHVSYRDSEGTPRRYRFEADSRDEALEAYGQWVAAHITGDTPVSKPRQPTSKLSVVSRPSDPKVVKADIVTGSLLHIATGLLTFEKSRTRTEEGERTKGTIKPKQYESKKLLVEGFLKFLNSRYGQGAVGRMTLSELTMNDIEAYNQLLVTTGYSDSQVRKRLQIIEQLINRAGRLEHGGQVLGWNWNSKDILHGIPDNPITIPTLKQLRLVLTKCDIARTAQVWIAMGCGFGQRDLAAIKVGQFDKVSYDCRRGKTGIDRYGETPKLVWSCIEKYLGEVVRATGERLFETELGHPLVHGKTDSIGLWWADLRTSLGDDGQGMNGFYSLRHLGATEFGSRPGCSISDMRRWLGHSTSSAVADRYMKPVSPEIRDVVDFVRKALASGLVNLRIS